MAESWWNWVLHLRYLISMVLIHLIKFKGPDFLWKKFLALAYWSPGGIGFLKLRILSQYLDSRVPIACAQKFIAWMHLELFRR